MHEYLRQATIDLDRERSAQAGGLVALVTMQLEAAQQIEAAKWARTPTRRTQRNGYRARSLATRVGEMPLRLLKLLQGRTNPSCPALFPPDVALEAVATGALSSSQAMAMIAAFDHLDQ